MARKRSVGKGKENVVAALDQLDGNAQALTKSTAVVRRRIDELDDQAADLETRVQELEERRNKEVQDLKDECLREVTMLQTRLGAAEDKLKKVQQTLA